MCELTAQHGRGMTWARHAMSELALMGLVVRNTTVGTAVTVLVTSACLPNPRLKWLCSQHCDLSKTMMFSSIDSISGVKWKAYGKIHTFFWSLLMAVHIVTIL